MAAMPVEVPKPKRRIVEVPKPTPLALVEPIEEKREPQPTSATVLVGQAVERLAWVEAELGRLDALKAERATLKRMIGKTK